MNQHEPISFTVPSGDTKRARILYKGGGGGGDGGAADRERERQARIAEGTRKVNEIFGIAGDRSATQSSSSLSRSGMHPLALLAGSQLDKLGIKKDPVYLDGLSEAGLAAEQRAAMYEATKDDTRKFFSNQLQEDSAKAEREMNFQKARQGIIGSSQANDLDADYQKRYDRGLLDVANRADAAATQFRTADEAARLSLISKVVSGLDTGTAAQNALNTLQTNQAAAKESYQAQRMGNVFSDLLGGYNQQQYNAGIAAGKNGETNQTGNWFNNSKPVSGEIT